jgi:hypothetical protein
MARMGSYGPMAQANPGTAGRWLSSMQQVVKPNHLWLSIFAFAKKK